MNTKEIDLLISKIKYISSKCDNAHRSDWINIISELEKSKELFS